MNFDQKDIIHTYNRLMALQKNGNTFTVPDMSLTEIHAYLFKNLYASAGQIRTCELWKNYMFERPENLNTKLFDCLKTLQHNIETTYDSADFYKLLARDYSELNRLHPFLDGNGRTQREFLRQQLAKQNIVINFHNTSYADMLYASKAGCHKDYKPFIQIFKSCIRKPTGEFDNAGSYYKHLPYLAILSYDDLPSSIEQLTIAPMQYHARLGGYKQL